MNEWKRFSFLLEGIAGNLLKGIDKKQEVLHQL